MELTSEAEKAKRRKEWNKKYQKFFKSPYKEFGMKSSAKLIKPERRPSR